MSITGSVGMDSKEAKALTKALQDNTVALQQHTKIMQAVLKINARPQQVTRQPQVDPTLKNIKNI